LERRKSRRHEEGKKGRLSLAEIAGEKSRKTKQEKKEYAGKKTWSQLEPHPAEKKRKIGAIKRLSITELR